MKRKILIISVAVITATLMIGCTALKNAVQMAKCEYSYKSVSNVYVDGIDISNMTAATAITALPKLKSLLSGTFTSLPIQLTVNLNVKNPSTDQSAAVADLGYAVNIDGIDLASGKLGKSFSVAPGKTAVLPVVVKTDLANVLTSDNRNTLIQMAMNLAGLSNNKSTIKLTAKPVLLSDKNKRITLPSIPISFQYGGAKK